MAVCCVSTDAAVASQAKPMVGVGDNGANMFKDQNYRSLEMPISRKVIAWDFYQHPDEVADLDTWLINAREVNVDPLISFGGLSTRASTRRLISVKEYKVMFTYFRERYPWVTSISPWNEVNHASQPTFNHPRRAAQYYNLVKKMCPGCNIAAADVLDQPNLWPWIKTFKKYAHHPTIWGLHNYGDVNYSTPWRKSYTKRFLKAVRGQVWMTETGGIIALGKKRDYNIDRGTIGVRNTLKLASRSKRVTRVYLYSWYGTEAPAGYENRKHGKKHKADRWDSGIVGPVGEPRPAFWELKKLLGK